jgi:hypothetical protein
MCSSAAIANWRREPLKPCKTNGETRRRMRGVVRRDITLLGKTKPVLLTGATGPGVIVKCAYLRS